MLAMNNNYLLKMAVSFSRIFEIKSNLMIKLNDVLGYVFRRGIASFDNMLICRIQGIVGITGLRKACVEDVLISILFTIYAVQFCTCGHVLVCTIRQSMLRMAAKKSLCALSR